MANFKISKTWKKIIHMFHLYTVDSLSNILFFKTKDKEWKTIRQLWWCWHTSKFRNKIADNTWSKCDQINDQAKVQNCTEWLVKLRIHSNLLLFSFNLYVWLQSLRFMAIYPLIYQTLLSSSFYNCCYATTSTRERTEVCLLQQKHFRFPRNVIKISKWI
jgi:hypothetical protein